MHIHVLCSVEQIYLQYTQEQPDVSLILQRSGLTDSFDSSTAE